MSVTSTRKIDADEAPKRNSRRRRERRWTIAYVLTALVASAGGMTVAIRLLALPVLWVLVGLAVAVVAVLALRTRFEMTARAEGVGLALATGVVVAAVVSSGAGGKRFSADHDPNHETVERVLTLDRELKLFANRPDRAKGEALVPAPQDFMAFVREAEVDQGPLLRSPWGDEPQPAAIPVGGPLPTAKQLAAGTPPVVLNAPVGPGVAPKAGAAWGPTTYGAVLYDVDPRSERYVLYGIGKVGDQAVVVHQAVGPR